MSILGAWGARMPNGMFHPKVSILGAWGARTLNGMLLGWIYRDWVPPKVNIVKATATAADPC